MVRNLFHTEGVDSPNLSTCTAVGSRFYGRSSSMSLAPHCTIVPGSSNGRTRVFGTRYKGSIPFPGAHAFVVEWIPRLSPKEKVRVRFPTKARNDHAPFV